MALDRLPTGDFFCSYNGHTFGPSADTVAFTLRPNPDPAGRTVSTITYTITVKETIADATTTDPLVLAAITKLERNGGRLRYVGRGFGDIEINLGAGQKDVKWGPWTREITCKPTGAGRAVELTWTVEFTTICPDELGPPGTITQFTYTVGYDVDREGYTVRNYEATLTIAQTRKSATDRTITKSADEHLEKMVPALPVQFRRESQSRRLSLDKCTLTLIVRDVQMPPNAPPDGCVDGSVEHTYNSDGLYKWKGFISATYDLARLEGDPAKAIAAFYGLVRDRIAAARRMSFLPGGLKPVKLHPTNFSAGEPNVYGRKQVRLGIHYFVAACTFGEILRSGGLWRPFNEMAGTKGWKEWVASVPTVLAPRGHAMLRFDPKDDALVDACVGGALPASTQQTIRGALSSAQQTIRDALTVGALDAELAKTFPAPTLQDSWIEYRSAVTVHADLGRVAASTLPVAPLTAGTVPPAWNVLAGVPAVDGAATGAFGSIDGVLRGQTPSGGASFVHQRTRPVLYVTLTGQALRAGYQIPMPELVSVNGARPVLVGQPWFRQEIVYQTLVPIVRADWSLTYAFTADGGTPTKAIPVPPDMYRS